nr:leucine zipper transcription factor-like protein 1 isoform X2 [Dermacentor andersoni]
MAGERELNDGHHDVIVRYLKFSKSQRAQRLKVIDKSFDDVKHARLLEETYTSEEVQQILDDLCTVVRAEVESELINSAHANVVLLRQLCKQAEQWHLQLQADMSELEDGSLIENVGGMELEGLSTGKQLQASSSRSHKLSPLEDSHGPSALLQKEIARMKSENAMLRSRLKDVESQVSQILNQKSELAERFNQKKCELLESLRNKERKMDESTEFIEDQMTKVKLEMEESLNKSRLSQQKLESDLVVTKQKLLEVQAQLDLAEKELEKKFSQTAAYTNMKKMLATKNDQIKELRTVLATFQTGEA